MEDETFECLDLDQVTQQISVTLGVAAARVRAAIDLLDAGNTLPFIARYRKEATKERSDVATEKTK